MARLYETSRRDEKVRDPRRDVSTSRDGLETETSRPRPHPCQCAALCKLTGGQLQIRNQVRRSNRTANGLAGDEPQAYFYDGRTVREPCSLEEEQISVE